MRRFKCTVAYVGANYCGWQNQLTGNSVQEQIEQAIRDIAHQKINIIAAGRTDAGVSAWGQVFMFDSDMDLSARKWQGALNGALPKDIHIRRVEEVNELFHARYCVRRKRYDYVINLGEYNVFNRTQAYQCPIPLDTKKMEEGARYLVGRHDFSSFASNSWQEVPNQVRTIDSITFTWDDPVTLRISFVGKGFLRYMVRMMSATLIEVGRGRMTPQDVQAKLEARSKTLVRKNANPCGLTLMEVDYFEILAADDNILVREFLEEDPLPFAWRLEDLEARVRENRWPRAYAISTRHGGRLLGWLQMFRTRSGVRMDACLDDPADRAAFQARIPDLEAWLRAQGESAGKVQTFDSKTIKNRLSRAAKHA